jgi:hypothetical protein
LFLYILVKKKGSNAEQKDVIDHSKAFQVKLGGIIF